MLEVTTEIESLDGHQDTTILHRQGWYMVTHFRVREGTDGSAAYNHAVDRVQKHNRHAAIRTVIKSGVTYYEIWDYWK